MPAKYPFNIYREQLWPPYHGLALWKPNPVEGVYNQVSIGDVGYMSGGAFIRMFNVTLPWDDESNKALGEPSHYDPLPLSGFTISRETFGKIDYYSRRVSREENADNAQASSPDQAEGVTYRCRGRGALLSLPHGGLRQEVIHTKVFQKYIGDNVDRWFLWSKIKGLPIERMEDLVLVYGCTLVTSWAAAAFDDHAGGAQVSLANRTLNSGGAIFIWSNIRGTVEYHDSQLDPNNPYAPQSRCVFIKCLRAKRILFWTKTFQPEAPLYRRVTMPPMPDSTPDSPSPSLPSSLNSLQGDSIPQVLDVSDVLDFPQFPEVPDVPEYLDPLIRVLSYIAEHQKNYSYPNYAMESAIIAVAHDNDLQLIEDVDVLEGDALAVEEFLREKQIPLFFEDGVVTLRLPHQQVNEHKECDKSPRTSYGASTTVNCESDGFSFLSRPPAQMQMPLSPPRPLSLTRWPKLRDPGDRSTANPGMDAFSFFVTPGAKRKMLFGVPPDTKRPNRGETRDQSTANPSIDAFDFLSRPPTQIQMPLDAPLPLSVTERSNHRDTGDQSINPEGDAFGFLSRPPSVILQISHGPSYSLI